MGKSTHTQMWHDLLQTPYLNGDLNLLGMENSKIIVYGIPWCGTSGIFTAEAYELGGIILLGRDLQTDYLEELNPSEKILRVMQRMISPAWTERQLSENLFFAGEIADRVPVLHLLCTKNFSAACVMKNPSINWRSCNERKNTPDLEAPETGNSEKNVETDIMDLSVRQTLLESHDPVYTAWSGRNRCLSGFQSDFQRSG